MVQAMTNCVTDSGLTCLPLHKNYRTSIELIGLILEAVKNNSVTKYPLKKYTGTNYAQLEKYLELLTEIGFIERDIKEDKVLYRVSERGLAFLMQYNVLRDMLLNAYYQNKPIDMTQEGHNRFGNIYYKTIVANLACARKRQGWLKVNGNGNQIARETSPDRW